MAERLLAEGEKGQHQCNKCLQLFDYIGNGLWIPTMCPKCKDKLSETAVYQFRRYRATAEYTPQYSDDLYLMRATFKAGVEFYPRVVLLDNQTGEVLAEAELGEVKRYNLPE